MRKYAAKLLLFGEYGLMFGTKALTIPFPKFSGFFNLVTSNLQTDSQKLSSNELLKFANWYTENSIAYSMNFPLNIAAFQKDIKLGLYFESDIPLQYGVGSSGALCAAIFNEYGSFNLDITQETIQQLKPDFSIMEACFHGKSSGLDPLVSYLNQPILFEGNSIELLDLNLNETPWQAILIDTKISSATSPLVKLFIEKMNQPEFTKRFDQEYVFANNYLVEAFIKKDEKLFFKNLKFLGEFQLENFQEMFPSESIAQIQELKERGIFVKLLGSGGGGFMLAFAEKSMDTNYIKNSFRIM